MAFTIPGNITKWDEKLKYCEAAKRKLIEWARANKTDINEEKFYSLLSEIDALRVQERKNRPKEFVPDTKDDLSDNVWTQKLRQIRESITQQYKDNITLGDVSKNVVSNG